MINGMVKMDTLPSTNEISRQLFEEQDDSSQASSDSVQKMTRTSASYYTDLRKESRLASSDPFINGSHNECGKIFLWKSKINALSVAKASQTAKAVPWTTTACYSKSHPNMKIEFSAVSREHPFISLSANGDIVNTLCGICDSKGVLIFCAESDIFRTLHPSDLFMNGKSQETVIMNFAPDNLSSNNRIRFINFSQKPEVPTKSYSDAYCQTDFSSNCIVNSSHDSHCMPRPYEYSQLRNAEDNKVFKVKEVFHPEISEKEKGKDNIIITYKQKLDEIHKLIVEYFNNSSRNADSTFPYDAGNSELIQVKSVSKTLLDVLSIINDETEEKSPPNESAELENEDSSDEMEVEDNCDNFTSTKPGSIFSGDLRCLPQDAKDLEPGTFYKLFEFITTGEIKISGAQEAEQLFFASKLYDLPSLGQACLSFIQSNLLQSHKVCKVFELAEKANATHIKDMCLRVFMLDTIAVIQSDSFLKAKLNIIEAILKLDRLNIDSESQIIKATMAWGEMQCRRQNLDSDRDLRICVDSLLKHLRFLVLSLAEFREIISSYNIFTAIESSSITAEILQCSFDGEISSITSSERSPRQKPLDNNELNNGNSHNDDKSLNKYSGDCSPESGYYSAQRRVDDNIRDSFNLCTTLEVLNDSECINSSSLLNSVDFASSNESLDSSDELLLDESCDSHLNINSLDSFKEIRIKFDNDKTILNGLRTVDAMNEVSIEVRRGLIEVYGVEIDFKHYTKKQYDIILNTKTDKTTEQHFKTMVSNPVQLLFPKPILIDDKITIKVTVETLQLQLMKVCTLREFDWESENNVYCIKLNSNQRQGQEFPFLIKKVFYNCN